MKFMQKVRERNYIRKIVKVVSNGTSSLVYLTLNSIKSQAANDVWKDKISMEFYRDVFCGGDAMHHYVDVNRDVIIEKYKNL